ncbi:hypothetical protein DFJ73DRAFT_790241 [Zopfochytrium polystomum]|nr:hypothetical protein DFJ73DRAFT_790241 [Zopfochytrium polystomum]
MVKLHSPLPENLGNEFSKAASIVEVSVLIPTKVIANAKGVAILTLIKAGFVWTGRAGAGLVVAKLADGRWSAPSAIAAGGAGFGAQIGAETDRLRTVITHTQMHTASNSPPPSITLGANLSVAAGPVGRESHHPPRLPFHCPNPFFPLARPPRASARLSIEGLVVFARPDTNATFYGRKVTPMDLLSGRVEPPAAADVLYRALNFRGFGANRSNPGSNEDVSPTGGAGPGGAGGGPVGSRPATLTRSAPPQATPRGWERRGGAGAAAETEAADGGRGCFGRTGKGRRGPAAATAAAKEAGGRRVDAAAARAAASRVRRRCQTPRTVTAQHDFRPERAGDLALAAGDVVQVLATEAGETGAEGWWRGRVGARVGVFPANYVA